MLFGDAEKMFLFDLNTFSWSEVEQGDDANTRNLYCVGELNEIIGIQGSGIKIIATEEH